MIANINDKFNQVLTNIEAKLPIPLNKPSTYVVNYSDTHISNLSVEEEAAIKTFDTTFSEMILKMMENQPSTEINTNSMLTDMSAALNAFNSTSSSISNTFSNSSNSSNSTIESIENALTTALNTSTSLSNLSTSNTSKVESTITSALESLTSTLKDSGIPTDIQNAISLASEKYDIAESLISAVIKTESNFNPTAVSSSGAMGLMQLMPNTAASLGVTNAYDIYQNIDAGTEYLRKQLDRFEDIELALAAYNAGPGNVEKYDGIPPFEQTQNYVPKVLSAQESYLA